MNTFKSQGLETIVEFTDKGNHGLFHPSFGNPRINIWFSESTELPTIFWLFAHEFYHWRQFHTHSDRGRYSEMKADKWACKMTKKWQPAYFDKVYFKPRFTKVMSYYQPKDRRDPYWNEKERAKYRMKFQDGKRI